MTPRGVITLLWENLVDRGKCKQLIQKSSSWPGSVCQLRATRVPQKARSWQMTFEFAVKGTKVAANVAKFGNITESKIPFANCVPSAALRRNADGTQW